MVPLERGVSMRVIYPLADGCENLIENVLSLHPGSLTSIVEKYDRSLYLSGGELKVNFISFAGIKTDFTVMELDKAIETIHLRFLGNVPGDSIFNEHFTIRIPSLKDNRERGIVGIEDYGWDVKREIGEDVEDD